MKSSHDSKPLRIVKYPYRMILVGLGTLMSAWYAPFSTDVADMVGILYILALLILLCAYRAPLLCIPLFTITAIACDIVFPTYSDNLLYALIAATALWAYLTHVRAAIAYVLVLTNYQVLWMNVQYGENHALRMSLAYTCLYVIAALSGYAAQTIRQKERRQKLQIQELSRVNNHIALQIHDACSHNLARIDHAMQHTESNIHEMANTRVVIQDSLTSLRTEINDVLCMLQRIDMQHDAERRRWIQRMDCGPDVQQQCAQWQKRLHDSGLQGTVRVTVLYAPQECQTENLKLIELCLNEMFTNIYRHAAPDRAFSVHVSVSEQCVAIMESNDFTNEHLEGSGHGTTLLKKEVLAAGGVWTTIQSKTWNSYIEIPLNNHFRQSSP